MSTIAQFQRLVIALLVMVMGPSMLRSQEPEYRLRPFTFGQFNSTIVKSPHADGGDIVERITITRGANVFFYKDGYRWYLYRRKPIYLLPDGPQTLVFYEWSGGTHCCITSYFLELTDEAREPIVLGPRDCESGLYLKRNRKTGALRVSVCDDVFASQCSGCWPRPTVVLDFSSRDHRFHIAAQVMRRRLTTMAALHDSDFSSPVCKRSERCSWREFARRVRKGAGVGQEVWQPIDLWHAVIALVYAGQAKQALGLVDQALDKDTREEMKTTFIGWLACSRYFDDLVDLNQGYLPRADCKLWERRF